MYILGQVRLRKGKLCPTGLRKRLKRAPQKLEIGKIPLQLIFNDPISSILPESAPDPSFLENTK